MDIDLKYGFTKEVVTNTARLRLLSNGVVHYTYLANAIICEKEHQHNYNALVSLSENGNKLPILVDAFEFATVTPEGRQLIRDLENVVPISKRAIVIHSFSQRLLSNFYIKVYKPIVPTKIFDSYDYAMKWLVS